MIKPVNHRVYYSNVTKGYYISLDEAVRLEDRYIKNKEEQEAKRAVELIKKFDILRKEFNTEVGQLKEKFGPRMNEILDELESMSISNPMIREWRCG